MVASIETISSCNLYEFLNVNACDCRRNKALVNELGSPPPGAKDLYFPTQYSQSSWGQFKSCLWKQWWTYWRSPDYNLVRYFFTLATAFMLGTIFWKVGDKRYYNYNHSIFISSLLLSIPWQNNQGLRLHCSGKTSEIS